MQNISYFKRRINETVKTVYIYIISEIYAVTHHSRLFAQREDRKHFKILETTSVKTSIVMEAIVSVYLLLCWAAGVRVADIEIR
mgnify:CR=1 FL=1